MPLQRRVPKFGFNSPNRVEYKGVNLDTLQALVEKTGKEAITPQDIIDNGLAGKHDLIKILVEVSLRLRLKLALTNSQNLL